MSKQSALPSATLLRHHLLNETPPIYEVQCPACKERQYHRAGDAHCIYCDDVVFHVAIPVKDNVRAFRANPSINTGNADPAVDA